MTQWSWERTEYLGRGSFWLRLVAVGGLGLHQVEDVFHLAAGSVTKAGGFVGVLVLFEPGAAVLEVEAVA